MDTFFDVDIINESAVQDKLKNLMLKSLDKQISSYDDFLKNPTDAKAKLIISLDTIFSYSILGAIPALVKINNKEENIKYIKLLKSGCETSKKMIESGSINYASFLKDQISILNRSPFLTKNMKLKILDIEKRNLEKLMKKASQFKNNDDDILIKKQKFIKFMGFISSGFLGYIFISTVYNVRSFSCNEQFFKECIEMIDNQREIITESSEFLNESLFNSKNKKAKQYKKDLDYLNYLKTTGITISEFKNKYLPKMIRYSIAAQTKIESILPEYNLVDYDDVYIPKKDTKRWKEDLDYIQNDFKILQSKDYTMRTLNIVQWETYVKDSCVDKFLQICESTIPENEKDIFSIFKHPDAFRILCKESIYDEKYINKQISDLENKIKNINESSLLSKEVNCKMDTSLNIGYEIFLAEQVLEQAKLELFINESILISEGNNTSANIDIIYESFMDKVKETIMKILRSIAGMYHKFLEGMDTLLKTDRAYLEKYKDIILKKQHIDCDYSMYNYMNGGLKTLLNSPVPMINMSAMDSDLDSDDTFINKYFSQFVQGSKAPYNISDLAKTKFRGGGEEITIKSNQLNMTDLYNFCYDYKKLEDVIKKDINNIQRVSTDLINEIDKHTRNGQIKRESSSIIGSSEYYSAVYESFILEAPERVNTAQDNNSNNQQQGDNKQSQQQNNTQNNQQQNTNNNDNTTASKVYKPAEGEKDTNVNSEKTAKELSDKASRYLRICGEFLGAKQTISEEIYKAYMSIIKAHVRDHVGKKDDNNKKPKDIASDQSTDNTKSGDNSKNNDNSNGDNKQSKAQDAKNVIKNAASDIANIFKR